MNILIVYSKKRKTLCLQVTREGEVRLLAPAGISPSKLREFTESHYDWIVKNLERAEKKSQIYKEADEETLRKSAKEYIPQRVEYFSRITGLLPTDVKITSAKTRFGSCNGKNSLCFSLYLMLYPKEAIDYVIVHELCHIVHKNHSEAFYALIEKYLPDYKSRIKILKTI